MSTNREFLCGYSEGIPCDPSSHSHRGNLEVIRCDRWFKMHVNGWIKMANQRCMERIEKAIKIDEVYVGTGEGSLAIIITQLDCMIHSTV